MESPLRCAQGDKPSRSPCQPEGATRPKALVPGMESPLRCAQGDKSKALVTLREPFDCAQGRLRDRRGWTEFSHNLALRVTNEAWKLSCADACLGDRAIRPSERGTL